VTLVLGDTQASTVITALSTWQHGRKKVGTWKEKAQGKREKTVRYRTAGGVPTWAAGWIARGGGVRVNVVIGGDTII
jgi:hypothetical protein